ncbi:MAG: hypothetical protein JWP11_3226 [Frankiales bacterium]|nr:hypothetical protein [Frankiales bacterium]
MQKREPAAVVRFVMHGRTLAEFMPDDDIGLTGAVGEAIMLAFNALNCSFDGQLSIVTEKYGVTTSYVYWYAGDKGQPDSNWKSLLSRVL